MTRFDPTHVRWLERHAALGDALAVPCSAQGLPQPTWVATSDAVAEQLGWPIDWWQHPSALAVFSGSDQWPGMHPVATVYSGHQFGVWAGQLGDGRALSLGTVQTGLPHGWDGLELQLKGSGPTPFSRRGDGRAVLRSSIREFVCSEAMAGLGIPTTRALSLMGSPLQVQRETLETAAVVCRVAPSFLRFGHFEHFAATGNHTALRQLVLDALTLFSPNELLPETDAPAVRLLRAVVARTAALMADWQAVGFCHGVMNTDNMSILGLTLDYGPFKFLDAFEPNHICNHSDSWGRYAFARQPSVAWWNLQRLAQALAVLQNADQDELEAALALYPPLFEQAWMARMRAKLGLVGSHDEDEMLVQAWLDLLSDGRLDHTLAWRKLADIEAGGLDALMHAQKVRFSAWAERYVDRVRAEPEAASTRRMRMLSVNPKYIPRTHQLEQVIAAAQLADFEPVRKFLHMLARPFDEQPEHEAYAALPPLWAAEIALSCSS
ncbi:MAG: YdiU family protein [Leptothrix ochracea]|uniref:protein adenylyltransferase SelO n=1 Tax=Leptothrix ochracea TaxID=735331 RepID=UPI0034E27F6D